MDRRIFLKRTAVSATGLSLTPLMGKSFSSLFGADAPGNRIRIGLIGCRNQGWSNLNAFLRYPGVECVSLCDIDDEWLHRRAAELEKSTGKRPPQLVKDWRRVIDNAEVDMVIIGTPDHWHCLQLVAACEAGKDAYVEKPLAGTIEECDLMVKAARKYDRIVQVGQWQRSDPHWDDAATYVRSGKLGRVRTVKVWAYQTSKWTLPSVPDSAPPAGVDYDMWLGPAPKRAFNRNRFHYNFRFFWDYAGGLMSDWGVHLLDYALKGMNVGMPSYVLGAGGKYGYPDDAMETPDTLMVTYRYPDFNIIWDHACGIGSGMFGLREGIAFLGENGTLILSRSGWEVVPEAAVNSRTFPYCYPCDEERMPDSLRMEAVKKKSGEGKGLYLHAGNMLDCMRSRKLPNADIAIGAEVARLSHIGNISCRVGSALHWDSETGMFAGNEEANRLIKADYRDPWKLPVL
ncbi:MAG: Gfo/Idh/MocA family oxidoreductase [Proteiniphilum sp.]|jgi:predicted dehydrogenase|nr:Gfo/Idh/MocA family oxidoreductase [Proteiniphilum sp.]